MLRWEEKGRVLVTGSCDLIGSEVTRSFARRGFSITGIDNNQRALSSALSRDRGYRSLHACCLESRIATAGAPSWYRLRIRRRRLRGFVGRVVAESLLERVGGISLAA
jgi:nucleoside-diphosphate-sugar epimerase